MFVSSEKKQALEKQSDINQVSGGPASVVQQFAKPVKKDLPPILNGNQDDSMANPPIAGLRTINPIQQTEDSAASNDDSQDTTAYGAGQ